MKGKNTLDRVVQGKPTKPNQSPCIKRAKKIFTIKSRAYSMSSALFVVGDFAAAVIVGFPCPRSSQKNERKQIRSLSTANNLLF